MKTLSNEIQEVGLIKAPYSTPFTAIPIDMVKEFIRELKEKIKDNGYTFEACKLRHSKGQIMSVQNELSRVLFQIDKLAGDKLI